MAEPISFTGERFLPTCSGEIWYEHWHRYALARQFARECNVLDVACGEGYGSALLAEHAGRVVGVDISDEAVQHATERYGSRTNLEFVVASCDKLPFQDASFDLAVSFETIEHISTQREFIDELVRVLTPDGVLLLSSPNKRLYSDAHQYKNEFHVRELYRNELEELLLPCFPNIAWYGQKLLFHSAIWPERGDCESTEYLLGSQSDVTQAGNPAVEPMYYIVACSRSPAKLTAARKKLSLFSDRAETVYQDYQKQTRAVLDLDRQLVRHTALVAERDELLKLRTQQMSEREALIARRDETLALRTEQLESCHAQIAERDALLELRTRQMTERETMIAERDALIAERDALLELRNQQISERERLIAERDALLELRNEQMSEREKLIAERDETLALRTEQLETCHALVAERDALLELRTRQMTERESLIAERDALLELRNQQMTEREKLIAERDAELRRASQHIEQQSRQIGILEEELTYRAGMAWWLKSPFRLIRNIVK